MKRSTVGLTALAVALPIALGLGACGGDKTDDEAGEGAGEKEEGAAGSGEALVEFDLYVMSKCPYGVQVLDAVIPAARKLGDAVDLQIDYIGRKGEDGELSSMHGEPELVGNIVELCALEVAPDQHYDMIECLNESWREIPENWEACAEKTGIDPKKLGECVEGDRGEQLAAKSFERAASAGAMGSPTIKINGEPYKGGRKTDDFLRAICGAIEKDARPAACGEIPEPPEVKVIALTDARCGEECDPKPVVASLRDVFPGMEVEILDVTKDAKGKRIFEASGLEHVPAVLFDETIEKAPDGKRQVGRFLEEAGEYQSLRIRAEFDPTAEICDNGTDDTGNGKVDCDDPTCEGSLLCREEKKGHLAVFVMSQCPYGTMALDSMRELLDAFGSDLAFDIHYIVEKTDKGFKSLHGPPEVAENIRQLCAKKHYPEDRAYMKYIWCRNEDIKSDEWKKCATDGIDAAVIEKCASGDEGQELLAAEAKITGELGIGASPTWIVNNRHEEHGIAPADIQSKFCDKNPGLEGCSKVLSGPPKGPGGRPAAPSGGACR